MDRGAQEGCSWEMAFWVGLLYIYHGFFLYCWFLVAL